MIATMNPLRLQATEQPFARQAVSAAGFKPVFVKGRHRRNLCLAMKTDRADWTPMPDAARGRRASTAMGSCGL
jgi:hypothetical protein